MAKIRWEKMRSEPETAVRKWKKKVEDECGDIPMVLVQNKIDLVSQSEIDQ